jgi:hypothetical protein
MRPILDENMLQTSYVPATMVLTIRRRPRPKQSGMEGIEGGSLKLLILKSQHGYVRPAMEGDYDFRSRCRQPGGGPGDPHPKKLTP